MKVKILVVLSILIAVAIAIILTKKSEIKVHLQAQGYLEYSTDEAITLAYTKCSTCHNSGKITNYCFRCGPPFIVVVHNMRKLLTIEKSKFGNALIPDITDAEAVAITEVWNALLGNWEDTWRKKDMIKMLENDSALINLLNTPLADRTLEQALSGKKAPGAAN